MIDIPGYKIVRTLGKGGMATVYLAIQESFEREVALKVMNPILSEDPKFTARFLHEARIVARLVHPNIVTVYDVGVQGNQHYLSMEYVPGMDLKQKRRFLNPAQSLQVIREVAKALDYAGKKGYVHRDVKPENIMLHEDDGRAVLMDFGIACLSDTRSGMTQTGTAIGTPHYMSPEQAKGQPVDPRSDIYSLGVVLYLLLAGRVPYDGDSAVAVGIKHVQEAVPRLPAYLLVLQPIIDKVLAKDPKARYQSGAELIAALDAITDEDIEAIQLAAKHYAHHVKAGTVAPPAPRQSAPISAQERQAIEATMSTLAFAAREQKPKRRRATNPERAAASGGRRKWLALSSAALLLLAMTGAVYFREHYREQLPPAMAVADRVAASTRSLGEDLNETFASLTERIGSWTSTASDDNPDSQPEVAQPSSMTVAEEASVEQEQVLLDSGAETQYLLDENARQLRKQLEQDISAAPRLADLLRGNLAASPGDKRAEWALRELLDFHYRQLRQALDSRDLQAADSFLQSLRASFPARGGLIDYQNDERFQRLEQRYGDLQNAQQAIVSAETALGGERSEASLARARAAYDEARELDPEHPRLQAGWRLLAASYAELAAAKLQAGELNSALDLVAGGLLVDGEHEQLRNLQQRAESELIRRRELESLQERAEQQLAQNNLIAPQGDSAFHLYRRVLELDPNNQQARRQIARIERELVQQAETHINRDQFGDARAILSSAQQTLGNSERLTALAAALQRAEEADYQARQPRLATLVVSDRAIDDLQQPQAEVLQVGRTLHIGFSYQNFPSRTSVIQAMLYHASRGRQIAQVPVIVSGAEGEKQFQIERPVEGFSDGRYDLDLMLNNDRIATLSFRIGRGSISQLEIGRD